MNVQIKDVANRVLDVNMDLCLEFWNMDIQCTSKTFIYMWTFGKVLETSKNWMIWFRFWIEVMDLDLEVASLEKSFQCFCFAHRSRFSFTFKPGLISTLFVRFSNRIIVNFFGISTKIMLVTFFLKHSWPLDIPSHPVNKFDPLQRITTIIIIVFIIIIIITSPGNHISWFPWHRLHPIQGDHRPHLHISFHWFPKCIFAPYVSSKGRLNPAN